MTTDQDNRALWVFGYGSLMWRPGFSFDAQVHGLLRGSHRALCVYSVHHRGTPEQPGLVLGLDRGGACRGVAFRVTPGAEDDTIAYLREREQVSGVYVEAYRTVRLADGSGRPVRPVRPVRALTYLADTTHSQYAGKLDLEAQARIVRTCHGPLGANIDYVLNTVRHLEAFGLHDSRLFALAARLRAGS